MRIPSLGTWADLPESRLDFALSIRTGTGTGSVSASRTTPDRIAATGAGLLHQVASPRDLYDRPATRFVAGFMGEGNFLPVHVRARDRALANVIIAGANVTAPAGGIHALARPASPAERPAPAGPQPCSR